MSVLSAHFVDYMTLIKSTLLIQEKENNTFKRSNTYTELKLNREYET